MVRRLSGEEAGRLVAGVRPWRLRGRYIVRSVETRDFAEALKLLNRIGRVADRMNHHPDVEMGYGYLRLKLTTHDAGGLTERDFKLAEKIEKIIAARGGARSARR
ncbi:MAG: 4a-hydroxytetrahydrobiopterin dehydratase [Nitrososphaerota archaeon]|nr:4a-hydroxytetrahydrobiopterin dehydratase [Candidatus Calditenuaceae archaeon]MDW8073986.1 4a-hydroxytetrahydrobiopterin dehydratase [Nitrososphaerota archaeon]